MDNRQWLPKWIGNKSNHYARNSMLWLYVNASNVLYLPTLTLRYGYMLTMPTTAVDTCTTVEPSVQPVHYFVVIACSGSCACDDRFSKSITNLRRFVVQIDLERTVIILWSNRTWPAKVCGRRPRHYNKPFRNPDTATWTFEKCGSINHLARPCSGTGTIMLRG